MQGSWSWGWSLGGAISYYLGIEHENLVETMTTKGGYVERKTCKIVIQSLLLGIMIAHGGVKKTGKAPMGEMAYRLRGNHRSE